MYIRNRSKYNKPIHVIQAGEFYASDKDELIGTLLGSCVAVCLYDNVLQISGMNHFMLPGKIFKEDIFKDESANYGITAIKKLIGKMHAMGSKKENMTAKLFGGGTMFQFEKKIVRVPDDNIRLAKIFLEIEDIPIIMSDVGNDYTRKIMMEVHTGKVYLKKSVNKQTMEKLKEDEEKLYSKNKQK